MSVERDVIPKAAREKSIPYFRGALFHNQIMSTSFLSFFFFFFLPSPSRIYFHPCPFVGRNGKDFFLTFYNFNC